MTGNDQIKITRHYIYDRSAREKIIVQIGQGKNIASFRVKCADKKYPKDWEIQTVTNNGIIIIYNAYTEKLVTKIIARKAQIEKLYNGVGKSAPPEILKKAIEHEKMGYNLI